ncbi:MAG TPA: RIP metalloprotease RseP [Chitinophagaceae bacterium]|nr:RIP metalloprotease RseP [Chitinophagaceae bacterium]
MSLTVILIKAAQLILSLSILVILHEFGHFITAKIFKCRVEKFYLFFDPWFSLFKKKVGETEYGVGWLPLGGYVKISGMIDESMDKEQMKQPPQPFEFRSKPAWQRLIVMVAGVTMNMLLAFFIFAMILWVWGEQSIPMSSLKYGVSCQDSLAYQLGFQDGDHILAVNGEPVQYYEDLARKMMYAKEVTVERRDSTFQLTMPENLVSRLIDSKRKGGLFFPAYPALVDSIPVTSQALAAGLRRGDRIVAIAGHSTPYFNQVKKYLEPYNDSNIAVSVLRQGAPLTLNMHVSDSGTLGFYGVGDYDRLQQLGVLDLQIHKYGFLEAFPAGVRMGVDKLSQYVRSMKLLFKPSTGAYKGLGGFGTIGKLFAPTWDWQVFWFWTAFLSVMLAFMNILPIPALDGGHVLFLLFEIITGRKPSDKFLEYAQIAGMVVLFGLLLFANGMDVWRGIQSWLGH